MRFTNKDWDDFILPVLPLIFFGMGTIFAAADIEKNTPARIISICITFAGIYYYCRVLDSYLKEKSPAKEEPGTKKD